MRLLLLPSAFFALICAAAAMWLCLAHSLAKVPNSFRVCCFILEAGWNPHEDMFSYFSNCLEHLFAKGA